MAKDYAENLTKCIAEKQIELVYYENVTIPLLVQCMSTVKRDKSVPAWYIISMALNRR